jgi:murein DD-endopeptidase MepM/ murein hydrolase activator NlpD
MRWLLLAGIVIGCGPTPPATTPRFTAADSPTPEVAAGSYDPTRAGTVVDRVSEFVFDGGRIEIELRRDRDRIIEVARNFYAVPVVMRWSITDIHNATPTGELTGVITLPAGAAPNQAGLPLVLTTHQIIDLTQPFQRQMVTTQRFGDPAARAEPYAYRLPYRAGKTFSVLQGFHGAFSHRGSNEYAVDFDCPVATSVLATRGGIIVAANGAAQGAGTTPEFLDYRRTNFVMVLHDDGTLGEYMHLAPSGVRVSIGQRVERGEELALSGNTGYSSTPHLHFQVITAADDGINAQSFPFQLAVSPKRVETPVQGRAYPSWE